MIMAELELKALIADAKKKIEDAKREIEKAKAGGVDVTEMEKILAEQILALEKLEAVYK